MGPSQSLEGRRDVFPFYRRGNGAFHGYPPRKGRKLFYLSCPAQWAAATLPGAHSPQSTPLPQAGPIARSSSYRSLTQAWVADAAFREPGSARAGLEPSLLAHEHC